MGKKGEIPMSEWKIFWIGMGCGVIITACLIAIMSRIAELIAMF